ncbi:MAG: M28 family metallopeptidase [Candidatus Bathyarchaeia archaeon]
MSLPIVDYLSEKIGERFGGTKGEKEAAEFLSKWMNEIGLEVEVQEFKFLGWRPTREATLRVLEPKEMDLKPGLMLFSDNTPKGGVTGKLEHAGTMYLIENLFEWPKYAVVDAEGNCSAYVVAFVDGPTISFPLIKNGRYYGRAPYVLVGKKEYKFFKKWMNDGKNVVVNVDIAGELLPDLTSQNVIGTLVGREKLDAEEVIICSHYDSAYGSPGANDNASGVEAMLKVAENMVKKGTESVIKFIAFGAEEYSIVGSSYYVESLKEKGELKKIKALINLDMVGAGNTLTIASEPEQFGQKVRKAIAQSGLTRNVRLQSVRLTESSDHWPFYLNGIPTAVMNFWPYNYYHQITDTKEKINLNIVDKTAKAVCALLEKHVVS